MKLYDNIGSTPSRSTMIIKPLNISGFFVFLSSYTFPILSVGSIRKAI